MKTLSILLTSGALCLQGCATYSFAPPKVELTKVSDERAKFNSHCGVTATDETIKADLAGADHLIDNYLFAYRCAARQVANGRAHFEIPAMLVAIGGAAAAAFGAPADVAIATGATVAGLGSFKSYYAPRDKVPVLAASVDALICVRNASVGLAGYGSSVIDKAAEATKAGQNAKRIEEGPSIAIATTRQYFALIEDALLQIENITGQRLSSIGSYSPDALLAEIKALAKARDDAAAKKDADTKEADAQAPAVAQAAATTKAEPTQVPGEIGTVLIDEASKAALLNSDNSYRAIVPEAMRRAVANNPKLMLKAFDGKKSPVAVVAVNQSDPVADAASVSKTLVYLKQMQPDLQECILRAKL